MSQATLGESPHQNSKLFSGYYLDERVDELDAWDCDEAAEAAFEELRELWAAEGELAESYNEDELLGTWIDEVLAVLGFDSLQETTLPDGGGYNDRLLFESADTRRKGATAKRDGNVAGMYGNAAAVLEAKQYGADFSERFREGRSYRDASHQIKYYLERTPESVKWGVLTNGRKWRLYGTKDYATEVYYEIDLVELLTGGTLEQFKYFYVFFRPEAFRETAGTSFLDTVWNESETAAQELGEDLQDNVFTALRVLGEGFVATNDLAIDPDDEARLAELKEQSLVLLYRLMFVFYAESRGLIHPDDPAKQAEYDEHFSLDQRLLSIHNRIEEGDTYDDYSGYSTQIWGQLQDLFGLIDEGQDDLGIPPYNGGLFDDEAHSFLADNEVADRYIAEVIHRLGTTEGEDGQPVTADYADLDTRHLGSIYEGLLEHEFRIAPEAYAAVADDGGQVWKPATEVTVAEAVETVEEGELYVVNDDGERKATGAYYTPDYVVSYIVEETIDPLLAEINADLAADGLAPSDPEYFRRFWQRVLDLKVLDPAMGSAHFLTSATGYLTEQVMEVVREQEIQGYDEQELRRTIAKECIYGVDINGMAVELGKLSMWLETLAADKPLAFLDHHLKAGNSLVGSDITDVLSDDSGDDEQLTLSQFMEARQRTLRHVMNLMQDLLAIDNDELDDIKSMEDLYDEIRDDPLYGRLFEIANVHTAEQFGVDVPDGVYEEMAGAIDDADEWAEIREREWFASAQATADEQSFFHWELEYPEVFFSEDGKKREDAGFDTIIGNPPYITLSGKQDTGATKEFKQYTTSVYKSSEYKINTYALFYEKGISLSRIQGRLAFIVPRAFLDNYHLKSVRRILTNKTKIEQILTTKYAVFDEVETGRNVIGIIQKENERGDNKIQFLTADTAEEFKQHQFDEENIVQSYINEESNYAFTYQDSSRRELVSRIQKEWNQLGKYVSVNNGVNTGNAAEVLISEEKESDKHRKFIEGKNVHSYLIDWGGLWINYDPSLKQRLDPKNLNTRQDQVDFSLRSSDIFDSEKIIIRQTSDSLIGAYDDSGLVSKHSTHLLCTRKNLDVSLKFILAVFNSKFLNYVYQTAIPEDGKTFAEVKAVNVEKLPIPDLEDWGSIHQNSERTNIEKKSIQEYKNKGDLPKFIKSNDSIQKKKTHDLVVSLVDDISELKNKKESLNLNLLDHLGTYSDGPTLADVGLTQPPRGAADSILQATTEQYPNLRVGDVSVVRKSASTVEIRLTARYKPEKLDDDVSGPVDDREADQWGYVETDPEAALRITDLREIEADLIAAFVPVAVEEAGGFAGFRETATKTNSLVDRLRKLTLPAVSDVESGLESYVQTKERAEELEAKIEETDALIDEIVYELYGLTDEEIEIVEEAVGE